VGRFHGSVSGAVSDSVSGAVSDSVSGAVSGSMSGSMSEEACEAKAANRWKGNLSTAVLVVVEHETHRTAMESELEVKEGSETLE
jgi:hypothetical protein